MGKYEGLGEITLLANRTNFGRVVGPFFRPFLEHLGVIFRYFSGIDFCIDFWGRFWSKLGFKMAPKTNPFLIKLGSISATALETYPGSVLGRFWLIFGPILDTILDPFWGVFCCVLVLRPAFLTFRTYVARFWRAFLRFACVSPLLIESLSSYLCFSSKNPVVPQIGVRAKRASERSERSARSDGRRQRGAMADDTVTT